MVNFMVNFNVAFNGTLFCDVDEELILNPICQVGISRPARVVLGAVRNILFFGQYSSLNNASALNSKPPGIGID